MYWQVQTFPFEVSRILTCKRNRAFSSLSGKIRTEKKKILEIWERIKTKTSGVNFVENKAKTNCSVGFIGAVVTEECRILSVIMCWVYNNSAPPFLATNMVFLLYCEVRRRNSCTLAQVMRHMMSVWTASVFPSPPVFSRILGRSLDTHLFHSVTISVAAFKPGEVISSSPVHQRLMVTTWLYFLVI